MSGTLGSIVNARYGVIQEMIHNYYLYEEDGVMSGSDAGDIEVSAMGSMGNTMGRGDTINKER